MADHRRTTSMGIAAGIAAMSLPVAAAAQVSGSPSQELDSESAALASLSLSELMDIKISGSGFFELPLREAPGLVYHFDELDWRRSTVRTPADVIETFVPGAFIGRQPLTGPLIMQRGATTDTNSKTIIMVEGQNLNARTDYGYTAALDLPLMGDIRALEVIQGPSAIQHGAGAISGIMNILLKSGASDPGWRASAGTGPVDGLVFAEAGYGLEYQSLGGGDLYLYAGVLEADGYVPSVRSWNRSPDFDPTQNTQGEYPTSTKFTLHWRHGAFALRGQLVDAWASHPARTSGSQTGWHQGYLALRPQYNVKISPKQELDVIASALFQEMGEFKKATRAMVPASSSRESQFLGRLVYRSWYRGS